MSYRTSDINYAYEAVVEATKGDNLVSVLLYTSTPVAYAPMVATAQKAAQAILAEIG